MAIPPMPSAYAQRLPPLSSVLPPAYHYNNYPELNPHPPQPAPSLPPSTQPAPPQPAIQPHPTGLPAAWPGSTPPPPPPSISLPPPPSSSSRRTKAKPKANGTNHARPQSQPRSRSRQTDDGPPASSSPSPRRRSIGMPAAEGSKGKRKASDVTDRSLFAEHDGALRNGRADKVPQSGAATAVATAARTLSASGHELQVNGNGQEMQSVASANKKVKKEKEKEKEKEEGHKEYSRRAQRACNRCKSQKLKCQGGHPCARCVRLRVPCEYATAADAANSIIDDRLRSLETSVSTLVKLLTGGAGADTGVGSLTGSIALLNPEDKQRGKERSGKEEKTVRRRERGGRGEDKTSTSEENGSSPSDTRQSDAVPNGRPEPSRLFSAETTMDSASPHPPQDEVALSAATNTSNGQIPSPFASASASAAAATAAAAAAGGGSTIAVSSGPLSTAAPRTAPGEAPYRSTTPTATPRATRARFFAEDQPEHWSPPFHSCVEDPRVYENREVSRRASPVGEDGADGHDEIDGHGGVGLDVSGMAVGVGVGVGVGIGAVRGPLPLPLPLPLPFDHQGPDGTSPSSFSIASSARARRATAEHILTSSVAFELHQFFILHMHPFLPILSPPASLPSAQAAEYVRKRSPFLQTVVCALASRYIGLGLGLPDPVREGLVEAAERGLGESLMRKGHILEDVQAIMILAAWGLRANGEGPDAWLLMGHAFRTAKRLGMNTARISNDRLWKERRRVWLMACAFDVFPSLGFGRPPTPSHPADALETRSLLAATSPSDEGPEDLSRKSGDHFIASQLELALIGHELVELVEWYKARLASPSRGDGHDGSQHGGQRDDHNFARVKLELASLSDRLDAWNKKWLWFRSEQTLVHPLQRTARLYAEHVRICHSSFAMKAFAPLARKVNSSPSAVTPDLDGRPLVDATDEFGVKRHLHAAVDGAIKASITIISIHFDAGETDGELAYAPDYIILALASAAMTLMRLTRAPSLLSLDGAARFGLSDEICGEYVRKAVETLEKNDKSETALCGFLARTLKNMGKDVGLGWPPAPGSGNASVAPTRARSPAGEEETRGGADASLLPPPSESRLDVDLSAVSALQTLHSGQHLLLPASNGAPYPSGVDGMSAASVTHAHAPPAPHLATTSHPTFPPAPAFAPVAQPQPPQPHHPPSGALLGDDQEGTTRFADDDQNLIQYLFGSLAAGDNFVLQGFESFGFDGGVDLYGGGY